jgi:hypothetical protein
MRPLCAFALFGHSRIIICGGTATLFDEIEIGALTWNTYQFSEISSGASFSRRSWGNPVRLTGSIANQIWSCFRNCKWRVLLSKSTGFCGEKPEKVEKGG